MTIEKIELVDNGLNGLVVSGVRPEQKEEGTIFVKYDDTYDIPVPAELKTAIQDFKKFMAISLNAGIESHINEVMEKTSLKRPVEDVSLVNFLDSLTITKVSKKGEVFRIAGKICNLDNLTIGLSSPAIYPTTEYGFYEDLITAFLDLVQKVKVYTQSKKLVKMEAKQYMLDLFPKDQEKIADIQGMSDVELETAMIKKLEEKGHIVMSPEHINQPEQKQDVVVEEEEF